MSKLLIATHNPAKLSEIKEYLSPLLPQMQILSLTDLHIQVEPEETGRTFLENAKLKAEYYADISRLPTLADDGGLAIEILHGEPGVKSNRWPGHRGSDQELITYCLSRMQGVDIKNRGAQFETCIYFYDPSTKKSTHASGTVYGTISEAPDTTITPGYPYRSVFLVDGFHKFYTELSPVEHAQINHRLKALKQIAQQLKTWYN